MSADPRTSIAELHGLPPEAAELLSGANNAELHAQAAAIAALRKQQEQLSAPPEHPLLQALGVKEPAKDLVSFEDALVNGFRDFKQRQAEDEVRVTRKLGGKP